MKTKVAVVRAIPLTTLLARRRPRPQGSHWFFPPEIDPMGDLFRTSSCNSFNICSWRTDSRLGLLQRLGI